ncbi:WbqC family protein [Polynucleobacter sp. IMCC 29146]|uniref:WbqC family protein n=1 Tax=Polynucleobacter sp. IMCC 29146 TaxID=2780953 RepID=UPI001F247CC5|nr:WbqC family protein [Polynucleobacter sp. IMCC 29146]MCE7530649.1 WbqC family protein [Polynucleobacter sp. IMCC 29146]
MKKIAILQSNYIPWKGYFDLIAAVDEFILYDDMQYTRRDWRNRNIIKTPNGTQWLTIPVKVKGRYYQTIKETLIDDTDWGENHWQTLSANYKKASHFDSISTWLAPIYLDRKSINLSDINRKLISAICTYLEINTHISSSSDYEIIQGKTERLVDLCLKAGGDTYISGPSAKNYINEFKFNEKNIQLIWFNYTGYPEYPQLWNGFTHEVSILDLLFNTGKNARKFMKISSL